MRGETFIHAMVVMLLSLLALNIVVHFGGYIVTFHDVVSVTFISFFIGGASAAIIWMKETGYRGRDKGYVEEQDWNLVLVRALTIVVLLIPASVIWSLGIFVDSVFIYLLVVWGYIIIVIAGTMAELIFKYKNCRIVEQKG